MLFQDEVQEMTKKVVANAEGKVLSDSIATQRANTYMAITGKTRIFTNERPKVIINKENDRVLPDAKDARKKCTYSLITEPIRNSRGEWSENEIREMIRDELEKAYEMITLGGIPDTIKE